jgi:hypothetical protein
MPYKDDVSRVGTDTMINLHEYETLNSELQKRLHFSAEDLIANQRGLLTQRQAERLRQGRGCYRAFGCFFAAFGVPTAFTMLATSGAFLWFERGWGMMVFGGFGLLLLIASLYILLVAGRIQPPATLTLQRVEGRAKVRIHAASDSHWKANVTINHVTFRMTSYAARLFHNDTQFRIYYVQNGMIPILLSAEVAD